MSTGGHGPDDPTSPLPGTGDRLFDEDGDGTGSSSWLARPGDFVGPYRLLAMIGEGGFGEVWVAERREPFVQRVALKLIKPGMDSRSVVARFEQERQALAVMSHPNIAKVLDGGLTPQGRPYFAMEYVKGESITQFCDTRRLDMRERLELFCQACEAVQHAHLKGIIHRDLKPTNVLAFEVEGAGAKLKVIDFGVAKAVSQTLTDKTIFTETGQMIGTPEYMSPEQAAPGLSDIDTRSDIYSLGVILYELVTGETPFAGHGLRSRAHAEVQRILREEDPPTPSTRLSALARKNAELASRIEKARGLALRDLAHALKSELEWIPMKAMRKEPAARYQTAIALAEDVRAYLDGRPISAAPETTGYRLKKYVQRHRGPVIAASLVIGALLLGLAAAAWQWRDAVEAKRAALEDKRVAEEARVEAERAQASEAKLRIAVEVDAAVDAVQAGKIGGAKLRLRELDPSASTRFDARYASARSDESLCGALLRHDGAVSSIAFDDVRGAIVSGGQDNLVRVWDPRTCMQIGLPLEGHSDWVECVAVRRDGSWYASGSLDETIRLWRPGETTSAHVLKGQQGSLRAIEFSRDGGRIFGAGADGSVRCWDVVSGTQITRNNSDVSGVSDRPHGSIGLSDLTDQDEPFITGLNETEPNDARDFVTCLCSHPTEDVLVGGCEDGALRWWSTQTGEQLARVDAHRKSVDDLSFSRSGELLASAGRDGLVRLWISNTRGPLERNAERVEFEFDGPVDAVALSSDASMIAIGRGGIVELRNIEDRSAPHQPVKSTRVGHVGSISDVAFGAERGILATSGIDDTVRLWSSDPAAAAESAFGLATALGSWRTGNGLVAVVGSNGVLGELVAVGNDEGDVQVLSLTTGRPFGPVHRIPGLVKLGFTANGRRLRVLTQTSVRDPTGFGTQLRFDASLVSIDESSVPPDDPEQVWLRSLAGRVSKGHQFIESADGGVVVCVGAETIEFWERTESIARSIRWSTASDRDATTSGERTALLAFHLDAKRRVVVVVASSGTVRTIRLDDGTILRECFVEGGFPVVRDAVLSADGSRLAVVTEEDARIFHCQDAVLISRLDLRDVGPLKAIRLSGDGEICVALDELERLRFFDVATGRSVGEALTPAEFTVFDFAVSTDQGKIIVIGSMKHHVLVGKQAQGPLSSFALGSHEALDESVAMLHVAFVEPVQSRFGALERDLDSIQSIRDEFAPDLSGPMLRRELRQSVAQALQRDSRWTGPWRREALLALGDIEAERRLWVDEMRERVLRMRWTREDTSELIAAIRYLDDDEASAIEVSVADVLYPRWSVDGEFVTNAKLGKLLEAYQACLPISEALLRGPSRLRILIADAQWELGQKDEAVRSLEDALNERQDVFAYLEHPDTRAKVRSASIGILEGWKQHVAEAPSTR